MRPTAALVLLLLVMVPASGAQSLSVTPAEEYFYMGSWMQSQTWDITLRCEDVEAEFWETRLHNLLSPGAAVRWHFSSDVDAGPFVHAYAQDMRYMETVHCQDGATHLKSWRNVAVAAPDNVPPGQYELPVQAHLGANYYPDFYPGEPIATGTALVDVPAWVRTNGGHARAPLYSAIEPRTTVTVYPMTNADAVAWFSVEHLGFPGCGAYQANRTATFESDPVSVVSGKRLELSAAWPGFQDVCPVEDVRIRVYAEAGGAQIHLLTTDMQVVHFLLDGNVESVPTHRVANEKSISSPGGLLPLLLGALVLRRVR